VIVSAAWLAGRTRPATATRRVLAPSLRNHPVLAYCVTAAVLLLVVLWGPTPAFRNVWTILVLAILLALGVTMLGRETAREFPGIEHGDVLDDSREQRAQARARARGASPPLPPATVTTIGEPEGTNAASVPSGRVEALERLAALRDRGAITNDEYLAEKTHVMSNGA
jgi:putative oligomerization/nucleic acid binding protein